MGADTTILTTCPRDCYDACGIQVAVRDGVIRHVRGDRNHPVSRGRLEQVRRELPALAHRRL